MTALPFARTRTFLLAAIVLIGTLLVAPAARADQPGGTIAVGASVVSTLSMTITDRTMNFGNNLSSLAPASDSNDTVYNTAAGPSVYYGWRPVPFGQISDLVTVSSSTPWAMTLSMPENGGSSPQLRLSQDDFPVGFGPDFGN